jgi:quinoprotein glucose dehydrogenase
VHRATDRAIGQMSTKSGACRASSDPYFPGMRFSALLLVCIASVLGNTAFAGDAGGVPSSGYHPLLPWARIGEADVAEASPEAETNLKRITVPKGFDLELWAAEPMLGNPVAFCLDEKGRVFVAETYRYRTSVLDIRHYMFMLEEDLACRTVQDRIEMMRRNFAPEFGELSLETEVIRFLEDRDDDGKADYSSIYADKFDSVLDGIASGLLARKGKVYFTNIPHLWELSGMDENGKALRRESMSHGYGVRFSFTGHDMHGLTIGPDGKLYFSIGDRGATVVTKELDLLAYPDEGAVFRCNLDGTQMEVVHRGLRNPQELAFDDYGNLFTGDNDFDHGDEERLVYIAEGGDSGWRVGYQHAPLGFDLVPWKNEHIWVAHKSRQADYNGAEVSNPIEDTRVRSSAYLPPVSNIGNGPSGLTYYPGTGLPKKYAGHFFLCHFKGNIANSKIQAFSVKPKGASFELDNSEVFAGNMQPTDLEFGPDGALYFADWGQGWTRTRKGRIYRVVHPDSRGSKLVQQTKTLIGDGFEQRDEAELLKLLSHADRRVRQEAHLELADRGTKSVNGLTKVATTSKHQLARIHAIWALGIIKRVSWVSSEALLALLGDDEAEVKAQTAKMLGDSRFAGAVEPLIAALKDRNARVRFFAAQSLGKLRNPAAIKPLLELARRNCGRDKYVQHAVVIALAGIGNVTELGKAAWDISLSVRRAALLAFRKMEHPNIRVFLKDKEPELVIEAARAINDAPIPGAMSALAALIDDLPDMPEKFRTMLLLRVLNANFRLGYGKNAHALAKFAANTTHTAAMRGEALHGLSTWANPHQRDRVMGVYRPLPNRSEGPAKSALGSMISELLNDEEDEVRIAAAQAASDLNLKNALPALHAVATDKALNGPVRIAALNSLASLKSPKLSDAIGTVLTQQDETVRATAVGLAAQLPAATAIKHVSPALAKGSIRERQTAYAALPGIKHQQAGKLLLAGLKSLTSGKIKPELQLEVLEAAEKSDLPEVKQRLEKYNDSANTPNGLGAWLVSLQGGDITAGEAVYSSRRDVQCSRCHKIDGSGGEAGPDLTGIGSKHPREYILESIVNPSAKIADGFANVMVTVKGGANFSGIVRSETEQELVLVNNTDGIVAVNKSDITERRQGLSGMPAGLHMMLGKRELRDLVEYLAAQKQK